MRTASPVVTDWDWTKVVGRLGPNDFAYIDPPYLTSRTRTYSEDDIDHERLVWVLKKAKSRWILSHYLHPVYLSTLGDPFFSQEMDLFVAKAHDVRTECLWSNCRPTSSTSRMAVPALTVNTRSRLRSFDEAATLSFSALDAKIDEGLDTVPQPTLFLGKLVQCNVGRAGGL